MDERKKGLNSRGVLLCGLAFMCLGILARAVTNGLIGDLTQEGVAQAMQQPGMSQMAIVLLILEAITVAALPIFCVLLVDALDDGDNAKQLLLALGLLALVSEIPYDLVMLGKAVDLQQQNPVFSLVICTAVLWCYSRFPGKGLKPVLMWVAATIAGVIACAFLRVEFGLPLLLCSCVVWTFRERSWMMGGALSAGLCVLMSPLYLGAPLGLIPIYFYSGEQSGKKWLPILALYPIALLIGWGIYQVL